ncbi:MAG: PDZ domain-containing protein [Nitrospiraceae bacterium]|nr:MAG: PDZ domain-containing protein [Nitrospiraceae bacterium]
MKQRYLASIVLMAILLLFLPEAPHASPVNTYDLDVLIDIEKSELSGTARIGVAAWKEIMLVRKGALRIHFMKLNGEDIPLKDKVRTVNVFPDKDGTLEIGYTLSFKDSKPLPRHSVDMVSNVIDSRGISLTDAWYPDIGGDYYYKVKATLPKGYEAVSEAESIRKVVLNDTVEFYFDFPNPLDGVNLMASDKYDVKKGMYNDIEIYAYFFAEDSHLADTYIEFTKKYLKLYEEFAGKFPYRRFSVVENFLPTGYSFPTFTLLGKTIVNLPFIVETSLGHEILHQWFGNHVYIDHQKGNWAEGLTTYLSDHWYEEQKDKGWEYRKQILTDYQSYITPENEFPLIDFKGRFDPATRVIGYGKTAMVFHMLRKMMGDEAFFEGLRDIVRENRFQAASWEDLKKSFQKYYREDLMPFFTQWVADKGLAGISIEDLQVQQQGSEYAVSFMVSQTGKPFSLTLPMTVQANNNAFEKQLLIDREKNRFYFTFRERPEKIVFDENYDTARELSAREFPPVIERLLAEKGPYIVASPGNEEMYQNIIDYFAKQDGVRKTAEELKDSDIQTCSVLVLGADSPVLSRLFGKLTSDDAGFLVQVKENPLNPQKVIAVINAKTKEEADAAFGKITHYGKYSRLLFENGKNTAKETEQTERGIIMYTHEEAPVVDLSTLRKLSEITENIAGRKIVYVGEMHDVFAHHAVQLDIIKGLYGKNKKVAVGMEMFQRPFQETLDKYIAGTMEEADFLRESEYFKRWGFDYNLYKPILDFAREQKLPVIALNMQREVIEKVSREGIDSLTEDEKGQIPLHMDFSDGEYRERLKNIFEQHKNSEKKNFEYFYQAQLLWDETMSRSIDKFLSSNPDFQVVALAGRGHLEYGSGIPKRTFRRNGKDYAIILIDSEVEKGIADYVVFPKSVEGITSPRLMVFLSEEKEGLKITGFPEGSVSEKAGIKAGDLILSVDGEPVKSIEDVKIHLLYKSTGGSVKVEVQRKDKKMVIEVIL